MTEGATVELSCSTVNFSPFFGADQALEEILVAIATAGFTRVGLDVWGVEAFLERGHALADLPAVVQDHGLSCSDVVAVSVGLEPEATMAQAERLADIARVTGAGTSVLAVGLDVVDPLARQTRELLRRATAVFEAVGVRVALEYLPYSPVRTVAMAWDLCDGLGWDRAGLLVDSWHTLVTDQLAAVAELDPSAIALVQVSDARLPLTTDERDASRNHRLLPGDGDLDFPAFVATLEAIGYRGLVSPEVLSIDVRAGDPLAFTRAAHRIMSAYWP